LGDAVPQTPWDLSLSGQARSDRDGDDEKKQGRGVAITMASGSGLGTRAINPGGLGAEPPGTRQPDEPKNLPVASINLEIGPAVLLGSRLAAETLAL
jgi:hypothetical protein